MSCGKHEVVTNFFYPCDDTTCVWVPILTATKSFEPGEVVSSSGTGTGTLAGWIDGDAMIIEDRTGTYVASDTITGADSGATVVIDNQGTFEAIYDKSGARGHSPTDGTHNGLVFEVISGDAIFLPTGEAYPQPGASSFMLVAVSSLISAAALKEILVIGREAPSVSPRNLFIMNDHAKHREDAVATTTTPTGTDLIGAGVEVSAAIVDRDLDKLLHYQGGVKIGEVALGDFGNYDFPIGMDLAANAVNHYQGMAMITFPDGVPGNVGAWMTEFETNMTGASVKGDRVLPTRWTYS